MFLTLNSSSRYALTLSFVIFGTLLGTLSHVTVQLSVNILIPTEMLFGSHFSLPILLIEKLASIVSFELYKSAEVRDLSQSSILMTEEELDD